MYILCPANANSKTAKILIDYLISKKYIYYKNVVGTCIIVHFTK